jgi:hypothetical protein
LIDEAQVLARKQQLLGAEGKDCSAAGLGREVVSGRLVPELRFADLIGQFGNLSTSENPVREGWRKPCDRMNIYTQ